MREGGKGGRRVREGREEKEGERWRGEEGGEKKEGEVREGGEKKEGKGGRRARERQRDREINQSLAILSTITLCETSPDKQLCNTGGTVYLFNKCLIITQNDSLLTEQLLQTIFHHSSSTLLQLSCVSTP